MTSSPLRFLLTELNCRASRMLRDMNICGRATRNIGRAAHRCSSRSFADCGRTNTVWMERHTACRDTDSQGTWTSRCSTRPRQA